MFGVLGISIVMARGIVFVYMPAVLMALNQFLARAVVDTDEKCKGCHQSATDQ